jgi:hypothetical protein
MTEEKRIRKGCGKFTLAWTEKEEAIIRLKASKLNMSVSQYLKFAAMNFKFGFKRMEFYCQEDDLT